MVGVLEMNNFPTCRTCKFFIEPMYGPNDDYIGTCKNLCIGTLEKDPYIVLIDRSFFCSDHTTKDGVKWVNWGEK